MDATGTQKYLYDVEEFINEIRKRPAIWDTTHRDYSNKAYKITCWEEVGEKFITGWRGMPLAERHLLVRNLQKRWKNLRDCFKKELNYNRTKTGRSKRRPYIFYKQLKFLLTNMDEHQPTDMTLPSSPDFGETEEPVENDVDNVNEEANGTTEASQSETSEAAEAHKLTLNATNSQFARKRRKFEDRLLDVLTKSVETLQQSCEDEDKLFFLSLSNEMKKIPVDKRLRLKADILMSIHKAQQQSNGLANDENDSSTGENKSTYETIIVKTEPSCDQVFHSE